MLKAREYQLEALEAVSEFRSNGITRQLISLPTGCGKTVIFALLAKELGIRTIVLAHTEELIQQAVAKFKVVSPEVDIGVVKAESDEVEARVVVASVQTASKPKRLSKLKENDFGLMIIDEAHHATAKSYTKVIEALGFFEGFPKKLLVGVTATPKRGDGTGLGNIFEEIVFERSIHTMIRSGYLSSLKGKQVFTHIELAKVGKSKGDFVTSELSKVVNTPARNRLIVDHYIEYASDRKKALAFCADVQHAKDLASNFEENGISSKAVYGAMTLEERTEVLSGFSSGKYKVVTNCQLLTEGFDEPGIDCVIMGRPTQSTSLFTQMIGRGTRAFPLKQDCLVLDFTDNATKHQLCTVNSSLDGAVASLLELPCFPESISEDEQGQSPAEQEIDGSSSFDDFEVVEEKVEDIDFFNQSNFSWYSVEDGWHLILGRNRELWVEKVDGGYRIIAQDQGMVFKLSQSLLPLGYALGVAEDWARKKAAKSTLARKDATWRGEPASNKQLAALLKMGFKCDYFLTKGEASEMIDRRIHRRRRAFRVKIG